MQTERNRPIFSRPLGLGLALVQLFDILIHAATDQIEPVRVTSNVVILLWIGLEAAGRVRGRVLPSAAIGVYILLNGVFLATEGFTNTQQGGAVRWMLFLLVIATLGLSAAFVARKSQNQSSAERQ